MIRLSCLVYSYLEGNNNWVICRHSNKIYFSHVLEVETDRCNYSFESLLLYHVYALSFKSIVILLPNKMNECEIYSSSKFEKTESIDSE